MARLVLISLHCITTEDTTGPDEAYLMVNGIKVWGPQSMNDNDSVDLGRKTISFTNKAEIQLWDEDSPDSDDLLGTIVATAAQADTGERQGKFTEDGADYTLTYQVLR